MEVDWKLLCLNRIISWKNSFKCILCTFEFENDSIDDVKKHIEESPFHDEMSKQINYDLRQSDGKKVKTCLSRTLVKNSVFVNFIDNRLTCYLCECPLPCHFLVVLQHVSSSNHDKKLQLYQSLNSQTYIFTNNLYCKKCHIYCDTPLVALTHIMKHFIKMLDYSSSIDIIKVVDNHIVCSLCNINVAYDELDEHLKSIQHVKRNNFLSERQMPEESQISETEMNRMKKKFSKSFVIHTQCNKCSNKCLSMSDLVCHYLKNHRLNSVKNIQCSDHLIRENIICYKCYLCDESFSSDIFSLFFHYHTSMKHRTQIEYFDKIVKQNYLEMKELNDTIFIECSLCQIQICDVKSINTHLNGKKHKSCEIMIKQLPINEQKSCETQCDGKIINKEMKVSKVESEKSEMFEPTSTRKKSKNHCTRNDIKSKRCDIEKLNSYSISDEQFQLDDVLDIINDLDELHLEKTKMNKFIPAHKRESKSNKSNVQTDKVSKFDRNILENGTQYINFCIKQCKTNIYNINSIKLAHINVNINFIVKINDYQFCLLCNKPFSSETYVVIEHIFCREHIENFQKQNNSLIETKDSSKIINDNSMFAIPYILKTTDESYYCHACKNDFAVYNLCEHYLSQNHMLKCEDLKKNSFDTFVKIMTLLKNTWYYAQFFDCKVCEENYQMEIEFVAHLNSKKHCTKVEKCSIEDDELEFHICFACVSCFYGNFSEYYSHCEDIFHKRYLSRGDYNVSEMMPPLINLLNELEDKKEKFLFESDSIILESSEERSLLQAVEKVVEHVYPKAKAYKFGSRYSNTALSNSDLDIFLDCDDMYYKNFNAALSQKYLTSVIDCFANQKDIWCIEEILYDTRIPIMKLRHYPTDFKCDISFSNGLACEKSKLVRYYNDAYKTCRKLILYLKKWVIFSQLSGTEGISTFTVSWLVIFYLQFKGVFPSVYELIKCQDHSVIIDGWECGYQKEFCVKSNDYSFVEHLVGLFTFYAEFDYQKYIICPYLGSIIEKEKFATNELPVELTTMLNSKNKKALLLFRFDSPMCMQDPTDLSQNSTKALRKRQLRCFKEYCSSSVERIISRKQTGFL